MKKEQNYNYFIDLLKFIFSVIIVIYHTWMFADYPHRAIFKAGNLAVDFYFIVTGYLMMLSIEKQINSNENLGKRTLKFIYKKIANIFPYILFAFVFGTIIIYKRDIFSLELITSNVLISEVLQIGILRNSFFINSATWYISAMIMVLFVLYPLANKYKENYNTLIVPFLLILFLQLCYSLNISINNPMSKAPIGLGGLYKGFIFVLLGNLSYSITSYIKNFNYTQFGKFLLTILEIFLLVILIYTMNYNVLGTVAVAIITVIIVSITFSGKSFTNDFLNFRIFKKLGKFGFIMYLNNIYFRTAMLKSGIDYGYRKSVIIYLGLTFLSSLLSYFLVPLIVKLIKKSNKFIKTKIIVIDRN